VRVTCSPAMAAATSAFDQLARTAVRPLNADLRLAPAQDALAASARLSGSLAAPNAILELAF
jgi:hypothetical protein